jgi:polyribonucleotide nucleotidyltransferase
VDVEEDGTVFVAAVSGDGAQRALAYIQGMMTEPEKGKIYSGKVVRVESFGAFVEIMPGIDGMVHISQLSDTRVNEVTDVVNIGDEVMVMLTDIADGKLRLSRRAVLEGWTLEEAQAQDSPRSGGGGRRGGDSRGGDSRGGGRPRRN